MHISKDKKWVVTRISEKSYVLCEMTNIHFTPNFTLDYKKNP